MARRVPAQSILFRTLVLNAIGFALVFSAVFMIMDFLYRQSLLKRLDERLQSELLVLTSELDSKETLPTEQEISLAIQRYSLAYGIAEVFIQVLDMKGKPVIQSNTHFWQGLETLSLPSPTQLELGFVWRTQKFGSYKARVLYYLTPDQNIFQMGWSLRGLEKQLMEHRVIFGLGFFAIWLLGTAIVWLVTYRGLQGVRIMTHAAETIRQKGELAFRVPEQTGSQETDQLAATFNQMLGQIQALVQNLRTVMDNIAHDIKTPITRLLGVAESRLRRQDMRDPDLAGHVIEECQQMMNIVRTLLDITAAESGLAKWHIESLDLVALLNETVDLFEPILSEKNLGLERTFPAELWVNCDLKALQRIVSNLLDNALKFTPENGLITLRLSQSDTHACLEIQDTGIGINPQDIPFIFQRFHRGERARDTPGNGLGLSFCFSALKSLDGNIQCQSEPGKGSKFQILLPLTQKMP